MPRWSILAILAVLVVVPVASAQEPVEGAADSNAAEGAAAGEETPGAEMPPATNQLETINRILEEDRAAQEGETLGYDPGDRRDPFRSLLVREARPDARGPRPAGIPGLLIDDLTIKGVFVTPQGPVAQVQSSAVTTSFILREGDRLFDGEVVEIRFKKDEIAEVMFRQGVRDPAAIKPFREVVKKLNP